MGNSCESSSEYLKTRDGLMRVPSPLLELYQQRGFIAPQHCDELIALIDRDRRPSTLADDNGDRYFRTSETCDLDTGEPAVRKLENLLAELSGIDPAYGEPLQGQRYAQGQEFKPHTDYFTPDGPDFDRYCTRAGQRSWTFMIYLNDVDAGGATRFRRIGKIFRPECGKLLCWNNRNRDGSVNPNTIHHGMKVRSGVKYIITKWYRERQWQW